MNSNPRRIFRDLAMLCNFSSTFLKTQFQSVKAYNIVNVSKLTFQSSIPIIYIIDKRIFLNEYEAVLIDVNGQQLVTEFDTITKTYIINQRHHIIAIILSYDLAFIIRLDNNEVSVVQTETLKDQLKELGFISLTVRLKKRV